MKKRNIILIVLIIAAAVGIAVPVLTRPDAQPTGDDDPADKGADPGTVIIDKDEGISATMGVEDVGGELDDEEDREGKQPEKDPKAEQTPAPMPEDPAKCAYEEFLALSPEQMDEFMLSFESMDAFCTWLVAAQTEYAALHPEIEIKPGETIDLSEFAP